MNIEDFKDQYSYVQQYRLTDFVLVLGYWSPKELSWGLDKAYASSFSHFACNKFWKTLLGLFPSTLEITLT